MAIKYIEELQTFHLSNRKISYVLAIEEEKYLTHQYWGQKLNEVHTRTVYPQKNTSFFANPPHVDIYLDTSLKRFETVFPAAGSSNSAIELTCDELEQYSHALQWIDVCKAM